MLVGPIETASQVKFTKHLVPQARTVKRDCIIAKILTVSLRKKNTLVS